MSGLDDLAGRQNGDLNILEAAEHLAALLDLPSVNIEIRGARIFGQGSRSPVEIDLSNGETMEFDTLRDMVRPQNLIAEVAACAGATPTLKQPQAVRAVALVRALAEHRAAMSDNDHARGWGLEYLQAVDTLDVDLNGQAERWAAFAHLKRQETGMVLRHLDGSRLVRIGWFRTWVRMEQDHAISPRQLQQRMMRVGWRIRGGAGGGRIKATCPTTGQRSVDGGGSLVWTFYDVPADWAQVNG